MVIFSTKMICPVLHATLKHSLRRFQLTRCCYCTSPKFSEKNGTIELLGKTYQTDHVTNIRSSLIPKIGISLHNMKHHPLNLLKQQIVDYFYKNFINRQKNPVFSVYDSISPVVTLHQNFDSLLVPVDHVSRKPSESFYLNSQYMLRAHTSAHQSDLIRTGLNAFLVFGDVYRRDTIDSSHYPIFHQAEGVRLYRGQELFSKMNITGDYQIFENGEKNETKQPLHTKEAVMILEHELKSTLESLAFELFGKDVETQWVDAYFPFTHPSWELEIKFQGEWLEVLGCGIMEQELLTAAGAGDQIGWAFGLGLERLAMRLYSIPDIRQFWRYNDTGFMSQFAVKDPGTPIKYKEVSSYPQRIYNMSFWLTDGYSENDFYDLVRNVGGDVVEQVRLTDDFYHPKKKRKSHCYEIVYRDMSKSLSKEEANIIHKQIGEAASRELGVENRWNL